MQYFAVSTMIGKGAYAVPEFPTAASLLDHLDYLGIDRAVVYSVEARDASPYLGNQALLKAIAPCRDRLFPAFVITPSNTFETGVVAWLRQQAAAGQRVFRLCPDVCRFPIRQIERVLAELAEFAPVLLFDSRFSGTENSFRDLEDLATRYPSINVVICQQMWGGFTNVLDLMWRCRNVYLDISWLHMRDTIELVRDHFGIERLLFGIGYQSHYGAAVGALAQARISAAERELVAHGNLEKLLKVQPLAEKLAPEHPLLEKKPLWKAFKAGRRLENVTVYDAHGHNGPHARGWVLAAPDTPEIMDILVQRMDQYGVEKVFVSDGKALFGDILAENRRAELLAARHPGRFQGYFVYNPLYADEVNEDILDDFFRRDYFVGFKILPSYWQIKVDSDRFKPVWAYAEKHHLPVLIHTWDDKYCSPAMLTPVVPGYPNVKFILGHSGGGTPGRLEAEALALQFPNVYLEFCGTFCSDRPWHLAIARLGIDRFIFGSDTDAHNQSYELSAFLSMPLPDSELVPALSANIIRIMQDRR